MSFVLLVKRQITMLEQPGLQCVDLIFDEMQRMAFQSEMSDLARFPDLREKLFEVVNNLLRRCVGPTQKMISNLIQIELAYVNTSHPDFVGAKQALIQMYRKNNNTATASVSNPGSAGSAGNPSTAVIAASSPDSSAKTDPTNKNIPSKAATGTPTTSDAIPGLPPPPNYTTHTTTSNTNPMDNTTSSTGMPPQKGFLGMFRGNPVATGAGGSSKVTLASSGGSSSTGIWRDASGSTGNTVTAMSNKPLKLSQVPDRMRPNNTPSDRERVETEMIKSLMISYIDIVKESLQNELVTQLYRDNLVEMLMRETEDIAQKRKTYREMRDLLLRAMEIVNEVRDFSSLK